MKPKELLIGIAFCLLLAIVLTWSLMKAEAQPKREHPLTLPTNAQIEAMPRKEVKAEDLQQHFDNFYGRGVIKVEIK